MTSYRITLSIYWLALGIWLGAMIFLAVVAAATFRTMNDPQFRPTLTAAPFDRLSDESPTPSPYPFHTRVLAGAVVGNALRALAVLQMICAGVVLVCVILFNTRFKAFLAGGVKGRANLIRLACLALVAIILCADLVVFTPAIWRNRLQMYDPAQTVEVRRAAAQRFDAGHQLSTRLHSSAVLLLAAAVVASTFAQETRRGS